MVSVTLFCALLGQSWSLGPDGIPIPETNLFNQQGTPYTAPGRLFAVEVPPGWGVALHDKDPNTVEFRGVGRPGNATLQIRRVAVPRNASPRQLLLNAIERRLKKLPSFKLASKRDVTIAGYKAAVVTGGYLYQGNMQYPVALEEVFVVIGTDSFVFHFECFEPAAGDLAADLTKIYTTFQPRPASGSSGPFMPQEPKEALPNPDAVPF